MKKVIISILVLVLTISVAFALPVFAVSNDDGSAQSADFDMQMVLKTRFLNMLNHNFVYGEDLNTVEDIVNNAAIALLDLKEGDFIAVANIAPFVKDMYGVTLDENAQLNVEFPQKAGYIYVIPRGFSVYSHDFVSATLNGDGTYTVKTKVTVSYHDGEDAEFDCTTLFAPNGDSAFGYNIISSEILGDNLAV